MINDALIAGIVQHCPTFDLTHDERGEISDEFVGEYINAQMENIIVAFDSHLRDAIETKHLNEHRLVAADERTRHCVLFMDLAAAIYNFTISKTDDTTFNNCVSLLMRNQLRFYQGFVSVVISGLPEVSAAQLRTVYETYLIMRLIIKYPILSKPFTDHSIVKQYRILRGFDVSEPLGALENEYHRITSQYDRSFQKDYGWTAMIFNEPKDRNLASIAKAIDASGYKPLYVLSSELVHASSFSIRAGSHEWLVPAFIATAIELLTNGVIAFMAALGTREDHRIQIGRAHV